MKQFLYLIRGGNHDFNKLSPEDYFDFENPRRTIN